MRILVVEDDARLADVVRRALGEAGYAADVAHDGPAALEAFEVETYDLVVLDLMLPGIAGGGMEVCRVMRRHSSDVPILMLTALDSLRRKVEGLDAGADDYLVKPFHLSELLARVRALMRRAPRADAPVLEAAGVLLDPATRTAHRAGRSIPLTAKEYAVLEYLMRNAGHVVSSSQLIDHAWDTNYQGVSNVVQTYIRYLRVKLAEPGLPEVIETRRGYGYLIAVDG
ncbi:response regulator transcription factor [Intrasporangium calvum]|uniref:Two component transcriptional regulator, winged helix family n=1 Tax=Intrasporangium calvum (strain ATCC 23552 / DSM 43043 / JCM 3097 / NBRC 12989 / NCIMB 10167 / NRRL B-3866 / 7 KIP) TaxID=710696 RepID=E6S8L1_INTC7|nr:response regulator transcription factor [Intrasporangium calvum]ADU49173.1 two component transcriptional regulator, winged helix family [Intrasporangium calvum DSM 43043]AXG14113.1 DNA-binding response regulator [Intrasporangium calvum]